LRLFVWLVLGLLVYYGYSKKNAKPIAVRQAKLLGLSSSSSTISETTAAILLSQKQASNSVKLVNAEDAAEWLSSVTENGRNTIDENVLQISSPLQNDKARQERISALKAAKGGNNVAAASQNS
jgi:hypothetical protein